MLNVLFKHLCQNAIKVRIKMDVGTHVFLGDFASIELKQNDISNMDALIEARNHGKKYVLYRKDGNVWRIQACRNFKNVKIGDIGGYVESEKNLSHDGNCWIYDDAVASENSLVTDNASLHVDCCVWGNAVIKDESWIGDYSHVYGNAIVSENAKVYGHSQVFGHASISSHAKINDWSKVFENAMVSGKSRVLNNAVVSGNTVITGDSIVHGNAVIDNNLVVEKGTVSEYDLLLGKDASHENK